MISGSKLQNYSEAILNYKWIVEEKPNNFSGEGKLCTHM